MKYVADITVKDEDGIIQELSISGCSMSMRQRAFERVQESYEVLDEDWYTIAD